MHPHDGGLSPDSDVGTLAPKDRKLIPGPVTILVRLSLASLPGPASAERVKDHVVLTCTAAGLERNKYEKERNNMGRCN